jgi:hypothetical protein
MGNIIEKQEAIRRAEEAIRLFGDAGPTRMERLGSLIEAIGLYCEALEEQVPNLYGDSCHYAARLHDERRKHDPEWQAKVARLRYETRPLFLAGHAYVPEPIEGETQ